MWLDESRQLYFKITHPGRFGFAVISVTDVRPELVAATPLEYLERLLLQNDIFGDKTALEGIGVENSGVVVMTSQPNLTGTAATRDEMQTFMRHLGFQLLPGLTLGNPGALAFYRDLDDIGAFDAHPANFVKDQNGVILPIDLILVRADAALQTALKRFLV